MTSTFPRTLVATLAAGVLGVTALSWEAAASAPAIRPSVAAPAATDAPTPPSDPTLGRRFVPGEVIVTFERGRSTTARRALAARGFRREMSLRTPGAATQLVTLPAGLSVREAIAQLSADPSVQSVQPNYVYTHQAVPNDPSWTNGSLWGMQSATSSPANTFGSAAAAAWAAGYTGSDQVVVGVIDEGIQVTHPDLAANIWTNPGEIAGNNIDDDANGFVDDVNGWDFFNNDASVFDNDDDHGTHVAGTIGAVGNNSVGVVGVNWNVKILSGKFLGPTGGSTADAVRAINYMTALRNRGVKIVAINNSWGGGGADPALLTAINGAGNAGIVMVAAAGNSNSNNDVTGSYPSNYACTNGGTRGWDCMVAVAAIDSSGARASFSSYGATTVDLGAPGVGILSTVGGSAYASYNGTSMATPHVTGAIALCASIDPTLTAQQLRANLLSSVTPTTGLAVATGGRLDVGALAAACLPATEPPTGSATGLTAVATAATEVRLDWTDGASGESAYAVQRATSTNGSCGTFAEVMRTGPNATTATVTGLTPSTTHCFRVQPVNSRGAGTATEPVQATTPAAPPPYVCSAEPYAWTDATTGTLHSLGDDAQANVTIPFTFPFYGSSTTSLAISSNGYLRMGGGAATAYVNTTIPDAADPNGIIAPWWDDLAPATTSRIYSITTGSAPNRQFVTSWNAVPPFGSTNAVTFQVVLEEATGDVVMRYQDAVSSTVYTNARTATVGLENPTGTAGTLVSFNAATRNSSTALRCTSSNVPPITITTATLPAVDVNQSYTQTLTATGGEGAYTWSVTGSLPAGLTLTPSTGAISGTPTAAGTSTFTVNVTDGRRSASRQLSITVVGPVSITTTTLPNGTTGVAYSATVAATGGVAPYTRSVSSGSLPAGLSLNASTGVISGSPTTAGTSTFTILVTDSGQRTASRSYTVTVVAAPLTLPGAFNKSSPTNGATNRTFASLTLSWGASSAVSRYEYCIDTVNDNVCNTTWISRGTNRNVVLTNLARSTTYYWQVRSVHASGGVRDANTGTWWRFTTRAA